MAAPGHYHKGIRAGQLKGIIIRVLGHGIIIRVAVGHYHRGNRA